MRRETIWQLRQPVDIPPALLEFTGQDRVIAGYLVQRGITTPEEADRYLNPDPKNLTNPFELPEMDFAVERLLKALSSREKIGIWGDFDMDGQTATSVLVECLTKLDADVEYYLPIRNRESHGIAIPALEMFLKKGIQLMVTCDTGISEVASIRYAMERGVDVIITDHHALPDALPEAVARVNPRRLSQDHPLGSLSGSAVAFELMLALCRQLERETIAFESIDLAAVGLIADMAPLKLDGRLIAQLGLQQLNNRPRKFVNAIFTASGNKNSTIDEQTIGYTIAPRLNAAGRLKDANPFVGFLTGRLSDTEMEAMANELEALNANRKWLSNQVYQSAIGQIERQPQIVEEPVILVSHPTWEGGVLGLAAGHLAKEFHRPAIVMREMPDGRYAGSARSVEGIDIIRAINAGASLLTTHGGHPMAAGLSLRAENLPEFKHILFRHVLDQDFDPEAPAVIELDEELSLAQITPEFHYSIRKLAPFGIENPPLLFCSRRVYITGTKPLGRTREHFQFTIEDEQGNSTQAVWWNASESEIPAGWFDLAYSLSVNEYKGKITLQAVWTDFHMVEEPEEQTAQISTERFIDFRAHLDPMADALLACRGTDYLVYQEPYDRNNPVSCGRNQLYPTTNLILASVPPSWQIFQQIVNRTNPEKIYLVFEQTPEYSKKSLIEQLYARIHHAVYHRNGIVAVAELSQALNTRLETTETALRWLEAAGKISIKFSDSQLMEVTFQNSPSSKQTMDSLERTLEFLLSDTNAFQNQIKQYEIEAISTALK
ncbi:single-stranded-DNA-specific exonuclease RecJ [Leptolinea sp. HRD-7]|nr:single-stranded-DNA-specific exonuclease RecJ [Leptolinea sp. HRD-7]